MKRFKVKRSVPTVKHYDFACVCGCDHIKAVGVGGTMQITIEMDDCKCPNPEAVQHGPALKTEVMH